MIRKIHEAFQPLGAEADDLYASVVLEERSVSIREDGPDAWGCQVPIPPHAYYKCSHMKQWEYHDSDTPCYQWISCAGSEVTVLYLENGKPCGIHYVGEEW
ncbi:MAG: hypothetical protein J6J12_03905 [Oscillospiraceae bacterium]|nr:hypothetical protein [Oscillospiraceae bacterium]